MFRRTFLSETAEIQKNMLILNKIPRKPYDDIENAAQRISAKDGTHISIFNSFSCGLCVYTSVCLQFHFPVFLFSFPLALSLPTSALEMFCLLHSFFCVCILALNIDALLESCCAL